MDQPPVDPKTLPKADQVKQMTAADAAKKVKRTVITTVPDGKDDDGKPLTKQVTKRVAIETDEVLAFKDHGTHVVVVTKDGQKFSSAEE